jgi:tetratricopeptide (TPR) repeat protein
MSLRRVARLHKGDFVKAEHYRKQAELLALHGNQRQMFTSTLVAELVAHAIAGDLAGIREASQAIEAQASRFPGWIGYRHLAEGHFELARGHLEGAVTAFERGLELARPDPNDPNRCTGAWLRLESACLEALVLLGRNEEARARGLAVIQQCETCGIRLAAFAVRRALALAEAQLGDFDGASARLESVIAELKAFDIDGLELGAMYEARTRVAIWASDRDAAEQFGRLTAEAYRYGQDSPLGARYERLWDEARTAGVAALPELEEIKSSMTTSHQQRSSGWTIHTVRSQDGAETTSRARALQAVCEVLGARSGHLYRNTPAGFELVCSHGVDDAAPAFRELIAKRFGGGGKQDGDATVIEPEGFGADFVFRDRHGVAFRAQLLMSLVRGARVCIGALILDSDARPPAEPELRELRNALA